MLCEECQTNEACYTVSVMAGDSVTTRHLCSECMEKMNSGLQSGNIRTLLSSLLSAITGADFTGREEPEETEDKPDIVCPRCHTTLSSFTKTGHLGCPACYQTFREQLQPMLQQIHGRVQHAGRKPLNTSEAQQLRLRRQELTRQLEAAVAQEDFETAAVLRDRIRAMSGEEEQA